MNPPDQPFISICIASYNYGRYLKRGFEAIKGQRFTDFEVIYLDDASEDDSVDIIRDFIQSNFDMKITLQVHTENSGLLRTKAELLDLAAGKFVMLCDADDWMADDCLELLAGRAVRSNADRIISQVYDIDEKGKVLQIQDFAERPSKWLWNLHHGCLYKREIIMKNHVGILLYPDDVYFTTEFNQFCEHVEWISKPTYYWLVHDDSAGRKNRKLECNVIVENFQKIMEFVLKVKSGVSPEEKEEVELLLIKLYYLQLFHELKNCSVTDKLRTYYNLRGYMSGRLPAYLHNVYLKFGTICPARKYAIGIMRIGCLLEKIHVMWMALIVYHILCKYIEFDQ